MSSIVRQKIGAIEEAYGILETLIDLTYENLGY